VTGASRGIGEAIARIAAERGARVTGVARTEGALTALAAATGGAALAADLTDPAEVDGLLARAEALSGPVDVLVNNAGVMLLDSIFELTNEQTVQMLQLNLYAPIQLTRLVLPGMRERGRGRVFNMSSIAAATGIPGMSVYSATKAGLSHFTRVLRQDLKQTNIAVGYLEVGPVATDLYHDVTYGPALRTIKRFQRLGTLPEFAADRVARQVVDAIVKEKRVVRLPRRIAYMGALCASPQRMNEPIMGGIG
jgi:short-subunit dehydrogenase